MADEGGNEEDGGKRMSNKDKIPSIAPLHYKYPSLSAENMPDKFILFPITFRNEEIEEFEVLFFHRLLKRNYGFPSDWEEIKREKIGEGHYIIPEKSVKGNVSDLKTFKTL
ncbi:MAG: hypothetical protein QME83_17645, partial [Thermodesulfobacteriota bacterium]|nr:hypothetical protein [Thermodesulfobacteriota bacterium]